MNTFTKSSVSALLTVLIAGAVAAPTRAEGVFECGLPSVSALVSEAGRQVAADLASHFQSAYAVPRTYAKRRSPTVEIAAIESVTVVASRLPPMEEVIVAATRLPIATIVVEASRLPAIETVVVEAKRLPRSEGSTVVVASATPVRY